MFVAATTVNLDHLLNDLRECDVVTWCIVGAVVFFTCLQGIQKLSESSTD